MIPEIDLLSIIYLLGAVQGVFLVVALLDRKIGNRQANRYLAFFLMIFTFSLIDEFLFQSSYFYSYPYLIGLIWPLEYLYGPLFYFYIRALTAINLPFKEKRESWHFVLFFVGILLALPTWILNSDQKIIMLYGLNDNISEAVIRANIFGTLGTLFVVIQMIVYVWLGFCHLQYYHKNIRQQFSTIEKINFSYLVIFLWLLVFLLGLYIIDIFFSKQLGIGNWAEMLIHVMFVFIIYGLGYIALRQPTIFKLKNVSKTIPKDKYVKSKLSKEDSQEIKDCLLTTMQKHKPYLDGEITLSGLADLVGCTSNNLSQVINSEFEKTFFDFINTYRIDQAKQYLLLSESEKMTILAIALEAGFNSKSAFYSAFKKEVGMTPSQYKKSINLNKNL